MAESYSPIPTVEFAWGYTPFQSVPSSAWVDESDYVVSSTPTRGRSSELDLFPPGTLTLSLEADGRRFDPLNADGPLYGLLLPNTPVRVRATLPGPSTVPIWYGYVDGFKHQPGTFQSRVTVPCTDAFKILAGKSLPESVYETVMTALSPLAFWHVGEADGVLAADSSGNNYNAKYGATGERGAAPASPLLGNKAVKFATNETGAGIRLPDALRRTAFPFSVNVWVRTDAPFNTDALDLLNQAQKRIMSQEASPDGWTFWLYATYQTIITSAPISTITEFVIAAYTPDGAGAGQAYLSKWTNRIDDEQPHMLTLVVESAATSPKLYVDGAPATLRGAATGPTTPTVFTRDGMWIGAPFDTATAISFGGTVDEPALFDATLSPSDIADLYTAATAPWDGDTTGQRIERVLDLIGWPAALREIDQGEIILGPADLAGMKVLDYLQLVTKSEQGRLFMSADGKIVFHSNLRTVNGAPAYAFTDTPGDDTGILEDSLTFSLDDTFLYDHAVVQRKYGTPQAATAAGVTDPVSTYSVDGLLSRDDRLARQLAQRIVFRYGTPSTRAEEWTVQPEQDPTAWPAILGLDLGDVVTLEVTPDGDGDPITLDVFVEKIGPHTITDDDWLISFYGSPVDATNYLTMGGDGATQGIGTGLLR